MNVKVIYDQIGSPTSAKDLAQNNISNFRTHNLTKYGIYNYCNEGETSWFEFAKAIFMINELKTRV